MSGPDLGIRWTIGDVSDQGFEALRLSVWGAWRLFGRSASYLICVNSLAADQARRRTGALPDGVAWREVGRRDIPPFVARHLDAALAEGVGWKFAPLRPFPDRHSLALDNDCILWAIPEAIRRWLAGEPGGACVIAADVKRGFGQFAALAGRQPRNSGIRGLPPQFDLASALIRMLRERPVTLSSELDEQGLQVAAVSAAQPPLVVTTDEVSICSPFPPHLPGLGRCGAHFVGLNARQLPWSLDGRPASEWTREHWRRHRPALYARVGLPVPGPSQRSTTGRGHRAAIH